MGWWITSKSMTNYQTLGQTIAIAAAMPESNESIELIVF